MEVNSPTAVNINAKYFIGSPLSGISPDDLSLTTTVSHVHNSNELWLDITCFVHGLAGG
jgi:hypothetical protein